MKVTTTLYGELVLLTKPALVGATESIGFKTDIFEAKDGTEQRTPLKDKARQSLSFSSIETLNEVAQYFNVQWGGIRKLWAVPLFQQAQYVGNVTSDVITCGTDKYDFFDNSLALLSNGTEFRVVEIMQVTSPGLKISEVVTFNNAVLYPLRVCFINGDISRKISGLHAGASINFTAIDEPTITPVTPTQFLNDDLYFFKLSYTGDSVDVAISQQQNLIDSGIGKIYQGTDWNFARFSKQYRKVITSQTDLREYKDFLFRRQGRYRPFWLPTYEANMRHKSTGTVSTTLLIEADQYKQFADLRKHIAIKAGDVWTAHTITASTLSNASTVQLTISPALNKAAATIQRISYLGLHRLDADNVEINYQGAGIAEASVSIIEIGV